jgi:hypothetical protein
LRKVQTIICGLHNFRGAKFAIPDGVTADVIGRVAGISLMGEQEFREFELALVRLYRSDERAQEGIAIALTRANLSVTDRVTRARIDEVLAMLQHVHDPFITSSWDEEHEEVPLAPCA